MRSRNDDPHDPQETIRPRQHEPSRRIVSPETADDSDGAPRGRRLKLGTPTRLASTVGSAPEPESEPVVHRGFKLGGSEPTISMAPTSPKSGVQPWILIL